VIKYRQALDEPNPLPDDILQTWAKAQVTQKDWIQKKAEAVGFSLEKVPTTIVEFPEFPGSECVKSLYTISQSTKEEWGAGMGVRSMKYPSGTYNAFKANVEKIGIEVMFETPVKELVQDCETKAVVGVLAESKGKKLFIKAKRAVVLCVGGFGNNQQMLKDFYGSETVYTFGTPGDTGDGIKMLLKAGADLWHMRSRAQTGGYWLGMKFPDYETPFFRNIAMTSGSWIEIGKDGNRFYDEGYLWLKKHMHQNRYGNYVDLPHVDVLPVHMIFDETTRKGDYLATTWMSWSVIVKGYQWSEDNSKEIEKGWIIKANTLRELATQIGRDPEKLEETVGKYNKYAEAGNDPEFGRSPETMIPIKNPPFYAVNLYPCLVLTTGGGRRNKHSQVLDPDGNPIPRLYEAGELGSTMANLYQNGESLTECIVFGRIAGKNAVKEKPWGT
jgi:succinate dehydrogenase/fumarate reductase flavoprotein subunit